MPSQSKAAAFLCHRKLRPMTQKTLRGMRTRAKKEYVASDRARRENVPRHILSYLSGNFAEITYDNRWPG